jgi:hypothetical protein
MLVDSSFDIEVGAVLKNDGFTSVANRILTDSKATVEEAQSYFNSLGYEPTFVMTTEKMPLTGTKTITSDVRVEQDPDTGFSYIAEATTVT